MKPKGLRLVWMNNEQSEAMSAILSLQLFKPHRVPYRICYQIPRRRPDPKRLADAAKKQFGLRRDQLHETVQRVTPVAGKGTLEEREPGCFDFLHEVAYPGRDRRNAPNVPSGSLQDPPPLRSSWRALGRGRNGHRSSWRAGRKREPASAPRGAAGARGFCRGRRSFRSGN